ncbi:Alpha/beta hydrolase family protein [Planctomycetes bacterium Pan216]|uniref:Alpha/beta hydrolase family protein n=1 Tax=Kolteria novifilia TaxID=2527975 RepID=A0A518B9C6_9BACT|nr:Alpha/beta hydrolase family protein [Planctomycetes bacterium Pan216]
MSLARPRIPCSPATSVRFAPRCSNLAIAALVAIWAVAALAHAEERRPPRLDRDNLLVYRDDAGEVQPVEETKDWLERRSAVVDGMRELMGPLPGDEKRCPLHVKVLEEKDVGPYVRRLITYASEPGGRVPAYLLVPKKVLEGKVKAPAVLCLHPTDHTNGHKVVVGLGGRANRQYAQELAQRGYVTLSPSYPILANYEPDIDALGYESGTMKAIWDNVRGIDLLESLSYVKPGGVGVIGHSLGGHNAVYTAVFDDRIKAVVSSCGLDSYLDYYGGKEDHWKAGRGWTQKRYIPKLADYRGRLEEIPFDFHEMIGALAPRPCLISAPLHDSNFRAESVDRIADAARPVYALYGASESLRVMHPDCDHDFPPETREEAYRLFDDVLR